MPKQKEKEVTANIKLRIPAGQASPAPPVGSTLGQYGVDMMQFINPFNEQTKDLGDVEVTAYITIYKDRSFDFTVSTPATDDLIKKAAGVETASGEPHKNKVGSITRDQLEEIAKTKMPDLNTNDLDQACKVVAGSARSMGITVEDES